jgi:two-component system cell cycle response regulator
MTALARGMFHARRGLTEYWGLAVAVACWPLLAMGLLSTRAMEGGSLLGLAAAGAFILAVSRTVLREVWPTDTRGARPLTAALRELELGVLLLTGVYLLFALTGGLRSYMYPLVYALVSFLMVVHRQRWVAAAVVGAAFLLEGALALHADIPHRLSLVAYHATFITFFAAGNLLVLSSLARRMRSHHSTALDDELQRMRQEARDFRLIASQLPLESRSRRREDEEMRMVQGAVEGIHEQLFHNLDLLRSSMALHSCALLWVEDGTVAGDSRGTPNLSLKEIATHSEMLLERPQIESPGLLAGVLRDPRPLRLKALGGKRLPPYYAGPEPVTDLCAIPLMDGASLRGLLVADRLDDRPFTDVEEESLKKAAGHVLRVIEHERVFTRVERGKYEQEQFYRASELLNQALTLSDVYQKSFTALRAMADFDLAVVTSYDAHAGKHRVLAVEAGETADESWNDLAGKLKGLEFDDGAGLVAMAIKNRHYMPATGDLLDPETVVFNARTRLRRAKSLLVLPLVRGDQVLGSITLAASKAEQYSAATREMLRVISHQMGVSLQNARMYQSMEERATTDGLTGLTNHRAFQERLSVLHALAERTGQKFSIILTDIDHFKGINDTYGHPVGDQVLKRVSALLAGRARKVDIVARYGGEEFVLVLPDTDGEGAAFFANKLREDIEAQVMNSEHGNFNVTISMGVAEFPGDSRDRQELIEFADQSLYFCKEHGRNCVKRYAEMG